MRKFFAAVFLILFLPLAVDARLNSIELTDTTIPANPGLSTAQIGKAVKEALRGRRWIVGHEKAGYMEGTYSNRGRRGGDYSITIAVSYNKSQITIRYKNSEGLDYREEGGKRYIHSNYNRWIGNLERDIPVFMDRHR